MHTKRIVLAAAAIALAPGLHAQDISNYTNFDVLGKKVQIHGFVSQGYAKSDGNNWLTMQTSKGSFAMTEGGVNISTQLTDKFRIGAQVSDRNVGKLGKWHPQLDWGFADYRFASWFGIRGGKVKTVIGLFNDTQDYDFLHTFALMPQSIYSTDMRDATIAHTGGDAYGDIPLKKLGGLSYTVYAGNRKDSRYGGYPYSLRSYPGIAFDSFGGFQYGADLRWHAPLKGLVAGASRLNADISGDGKIIGINAPPIPGPPMPPVGTPAMESTTKEYTNQFYGEYTIGKLTLDAEARRYWRDHIASAGVSNRVLVTNNAWYVSGSYRFSKLIEIGSYYSSIRTFLSVDNAPGGDPSLPANHVKDKVLTARFDLTGHWNFKVEGHFMDGYGNAGYPSGFYDVDNPRGLQPKTNALIIRTGWNF